MPQQKREIEKIASNATPLSQLGLAAIADSLMSQMFQIGEDALRAHPDDLERHSHPSGRNEVGISIDEEMSHGPWLWTTDQTPEVYYDATHSWMTDALDVEKHPALNNLDYFARLGRLAHEDKTPTEDKTRVQEAFVKMMMDFWPEADRVLPVSAGGLAVDDAIEIAQGQIAMKLGKESKELKFVTFKGAFGGRYDKGANITDNESKVGHKHSGIADHVTAPILYFSKDGQIDEKKTDEVFEKSMGEVGELLQQDSYGCVVIEYPLQAEGGARLVDERVLKNLHDLCQKHGKVLVVDCVQMGGRAWTIKDGGFVSPFAEEILDNADIITFGKVFHANGTMVRDFTKLDRGFDQNWVDVFGPKRLGGTWTGHLSQMASGWAIMQTVIKEKLWENVLEITKMFSEAFKEFLVKYPDLLTNVRSRDKVGYLGLGFQSQPQRDAWKKLEFDNEHVIFLPAGEDSIRLAPALDMTKDEARALITAMENQLIELSDTSN